MTIAETGKLVRKRDDVDTFFKQHTHGYLFTQEQVDEFILTKMELTALQEVIKERPAWSGDKTFIFVMSLSLVILGFAAGTTIRDYAK